MPGDPGLDAVAHVQLSLIESVVGGMGRRARGEGVTLPGPQSHWRTPRRMAGYVVPVTLSADEGFPFGKRENADWWTTLCLAVGTVAVMGIPWANFYPS